MTSGMVEIMTAWLGGFVAAGAVASMVLLCVATVLGDDPRELARRLYQYVCRNLRLLRILIEDRRPYPSQVQEAAVTPESMSVAVIDLDKGEEVKLVRWVDATKGELIRYVPANPDAQRHDVLVHQKGHFRVVWLPDED